VEDGFDEDAPKEPVTKLGDLWLLGNHRLLCGDSASFADVERLMDGAMANCVITSPSYAMQRKDDYGGIPPEKYPGWFMEVAQNVYQAFADSGSLYVMKTIIALVEGGWRYADQLIWTKTGLPGGWPGRLRNDFEPVHILAKKEQIGWMVQLVDVDEERLETLPVDLVNMYEDIFHFTKLKKIKFKPRSVGKSLQEGRIMSMFNRDCICLDCLLNHTKGVWYGQPFELLPWQDKIIRDVFGTVKEDGYRQYNTAYVEVPKKNGKSELAAAVALYLTCGDGEWGAEVYGCAADRQQASIVFDVAVDMVEQSPALKKRIKPVLSRKRLVYMPTGSFYQVLSPEAYTKHGFNVHGVVFDELHAQPNRQLYDVMTKGSGDARAGFTVVPFGQGYKDMSLPTKELMKLTLEGKIAHGGHPALTWMMDNIHVQTDPAGEYKAG
jgi:hypothetical protein